MEKYKVGDTVMIKSYKQAKEGNGIVTDNYIAILLSKDSKESQKATGMNLQESAFVVISDKDPKQYYRIKYEHIIKKMDDVYEYEIY